MLKLSHMKQFFTKIFVSLAVVASALTMATMAQSTPVYADGGDTASTFSCRYLLGMKSWDCGVKDFNSTENLTTNIWIIASNVLTDMTVVATYLVLGFVIYGGYLYIFASGDTGKVMNAKKTLTRAFIGLAIVLLSNVILNTIRIALVGSDGALVDCVNQNCVNPGETGASNLARNLIQWFIGTAGIVAAIYVVIGGVGYLTSSGDSAKLQKSKNAITYALIGLVIVALAEIITTFVFNLINDSNTTSSITTTLIAKELPHEQIS